MTRDSAVALEATQLGVDLSSANETAQPTMLTAIQSREGPQTFAGDDSGKRG